MLNYIISYVVRFFIQPDSSTPSPVSRWRHSEAAHVVRLSGGNLKMENALDYLAILAVFASRSDFTALVSDSS
jgi:hypothetical protein